MIFKSNFVDETGSENDPAVFSFGVTENVVINSTSSPKTCHTTTDDGLVPILYVRASSQFPSTTTYVHVYSKALVGL